MDKEREKRLAAVVLASFDVCDYWETAVADSVKKNSEELTLDGLPPLMEVLIEKVNELEEVSDSVTKTQRH